MPALLALLAIGMITYGLWPDEIAISIEQSNFGVRGQDEVGNTRIKIRNCGFSACHILRTETQCSCTTAASEVLTVPPFSTRFIDVGWDFHGRSGKNITKLGVIYRLADSEERKWECELEAIVIPDIEYAPNEVVLSNLSPSATISYKYNKPCKVQSVSVNDQRLEVHHNAEDKTIGIKLAKGVRLTDSIGLFSPDTSILVIKSNSAGDPMKMIVVRLK